ANYYFNKLERDRLLAAMRKYGDFTGMTGEWACEGTLEKGQKKSEFKLSIREEKDKEGKNEHTMVRLMIGKIEYRLEPLKADQGARNFQDPAGSGGLLAALYQYRRLLTTPPAAIEKNFERHVSHGGHEPIYPIPPNDEKPKGLQNLRVDTEVLHTEHAAGL